MESESQKYPKGFHLVCLLYAFAGFCCVCLAVDIQRPEYLVHPQSRITFESLMMWLLISGIMCSVSALALLFRCEIARTAIVMDFNISIMILLFTLMASALGVSGLQFSELWEVVLIFTLICLSGCLYYSSAPVKAWCANSKSDEINGIPGLR